MALEDFPVYKVGEQNGKVTIHKLNKDGNIIGTALPGEFSYLGFTAENPSPVDPKSSVSGYHIVNEPVVMEFKDVNPVSAKIIAGNSTGATWATADSKKIVEDIASAKKNLEEQYEAYLKKMTAADHAAAYQEHLGKYAHNYLVDEYGNAHTVNEPAKNKKKMPKIKKDYVVGDRVEAVREFGNTGIKEGRTGTVVKLYTDTQRPLIVQWDDHDVSHNKEWNYPFKDVRPVKFVPGEPTEYSLF